MFLFCCSVGVIIYKLKQLFSWNSKQNSNLCKKNYHIQYSCKDSLTLCCYGSLISWLRLADWSGLTDAIWLKLTSWHWITDAERNWTRLTRRYRLIQSGWLRLIDGDWMTDTDWLRLTDWGWLTDADWLTLTELDLLTDWLTDTDSLRLLLWRLTLTDADWWGSQASRQGLTVTTWNWILLKFGGMLHEKMNVYVHWREGPEHVTSGLPDHGLKIVAF